MSVLRRRTGIGAAGSIALGLLAGGCVLAATAGPRQAQATGTRALQQTLDGVPPFDKSVVATTSWGSVNTIFGGGGGTFGGYGLALTSANLAGVTSQLRRDFSGGPLRLDPRSADWTALTSNLYVTSPRAHPQGDPREARGGLPLPAGGPSAAAVRHHADRPPPRLPRRRGDPGRDHRADGQDVRA